MKPETYYEELPVVMKEVPPLPGEEALYGWISSVWEAAAKDPKTKQALVESFVAADANSSIRCFNSNTTDETSATVGHAPANASQWGTDYLNRTAVSKSSMYSNRPKRPNTSSKKPTAMGAPERKQSIHGYVCERKAAAR